MCINDTLGSNKTLYELLQEPAYMVNRYLEATRIIRYYRRLKKENK